MIVTTTNDIAGKRVINYQGIVFGEVVSGVNFMRDIGAGFRNVFGGRAEGYEEELQIAREEAIQEMIARANNIGANAIIGMKMDYEVLGSDNGMLMVTCSGTAVVVD